MTPQGGGGAGRFAPSPSGRMHLGNLFTALVSWVAARRRGAAWILRIEDLDPQRSKPEFAAMIEDDLCWLGLEPDEGGLSWGGPRGPYSQSLRGDTYAEAMRRLESLGLTYPCTCRRADILATQAPHQSDGRVIYAGTCRPRHMPARGVPVPSAPHSVRVFVPARTVEFTDLVFGLQTADLAADCGDFVLRRADGAWAYQLAVVADDALMGVDEVVRGCDLLLSASQQLYLYDLLGWKPPRFAHLPLLCNAAGQRLSKRDTSLSMESLRRDWSPERLVGRLAELAGLNPGGAPRRPSDLVEGFDWANIPRTATIRVS